MKAVIPVAGAGTKLRPLSFTQPKALIPLAGKTVLSIIIDQLKEAGISEFLFIIGYLGDKIKNYVQENHPDIKTHFINQQERRGTGHAVSLAKETIAGEEVLIALGDTICDYDIQAVINSRQSMIGVKKVDDPRGFGVAEIDTEGIIESVIEKPQIPKSNMAMVGIYKIIETDLLFECLESNLYSGHTSHGEYSITDAIDSMIHRGVSFQAFKVDNWFDAGNKDSLLRANAILLKKQQKQSVENIFSDSVIIPPVAIGNNCNIKNSVVGPYVSLGDNTQLENCIVSNSIVGTYSNISTIVLQDSLIGSDTILKGESRILNIGDNTNIDLG